MVLLLFWVPGLNICWAELLYCGQPTQYAYCTPYAYFKYSKVNGLLPNHISPENNDISWKTNDAEWRKSLPRPGLGHHTTGKHRTVNGREIFDTDQEIGWRAALYPISSAIKLGAFQIVCPAGLLSFYHSALITGFWVHSLE